MVKKTCGRPDISSAYVQVTGSHFNTECVVISVTTVNYINEMFYVVYLSFVKLHTDIWGFRFTLVNDFLSLTYVYVGLNPFYGYLENVKYVTQCDPPTC